MRHQCRSDSFDCHSCLDQNHPGIARNHWKCHEFTVGCSVIKVARIAKFEEDLVEDLDLNMVIRSDNDDALTLKMMKPN